MVRRRRSAEAVPGARTSQELCAAGWPKQGYSANEIAAWSGHATLTEIRRYTDAADQERMARNAMARENIVAPEECQTPIMFDTLRR